MMTIPDVLDFSLALGNVTKDVGKGVGNDASLLRLISFSFHRVRLSSACLAVGKDGTYVKRLTWMSSGTMLIRTCTYMYM